MTWNWDRLVCGMSVLLAVGVARAEPEANATATGAAADRPVIRRAATARVETRRIGELSGVVASRKQPGYFWTHGDSGAEPKIAAFDANGNVVAQVTIAGAYNVDWEDICADEAGHLYIGDLGDGGGYPTRTVYEIAEPDPLAPPTEPVEIVAKYEFRYPHDRKFDIEALFYYGDAIYVIGKSRWPGARLYRIEPIGEGAAKLVEVATLPVTLATAADVSADGKRLLVSSYPGLWVYPITGGDSFVDAAHPQLVNYEVDSRIEGACFDADGITLLGENGCMIRVSNDEVQKQVRLIVGEK